MNARISALRSRVVEWIALEEGSTRAIGLVRLGAGALLWTAYASDFVLWQSIPGGHGTNISPTVGLIWTTAGALFLVGSTMMLVGWRSSLACAMTAAGLGLCYFGLGEAFGIKRFLHHHTQLLTLTCIALAFSPAGRSFSLDRWLALRRARAAGDAPPSERAPLTAQRAICVLVSTIYFWGAIDKMRWPFLNGHEMQRLFVWYFTDSILPTFPGFVALMAVFSCALVALEIVLAFGLWSRRWQRPVMVAGAIFHVGMFLTLEVGSFGTMMCLLYVLFFPPQKVHDVIDDVLGRP
jgi:hypothetical protein